MDNYVIVKYEVITTCTNMANAAVSSTRGSKSTSRDMFTLFSITSNTLAIENSRQDTNLSVYS